jgi:hypothetical protein
MGYDPAIIHADSRYFIGRQFSDTPDKRSRDGRVVRIEVRRNRRHYAHRYDQRKRGYPLG